MVLTDEEKKENVPEASFHQILPRACETLLLLITVLYLFISCSVNKNVHFIKNSRDYELHRSELFKKDSFQSFSTTISLSPKEEAVNHQLITLRQEMINCYDSIHFFPPAKYFYKSKDHIYSTTLFQTLKKMPKGGIQHLHPDAAVSVRWLVQRALREPNCYVFWQPDNKQYVKGQMHFYRYGEAPEGFYPITTLNNSIQNFSDELINLMTFDITMGRDSVDIWREFEKRFDRIGGFTSYMPVYQDFLLSIFDSLVAESLKISVGTNEAGNKNGKWLLCLDRPRSSSN